MGPLTSSSAPHQEAPASLPQSAVVVPSPTTTVTRQAATASRQAAATEKGAAAAAFYVASTRGPTTSSITRSGCQVRHLYRLNLSCMDSTVAPIPTMFRQAMQDSSWPAAMAEDYWALVDNNTLSLVPHPPHANIVTVKWICRQKFHSDGTLARYKACWVIRGYSQRWSIDYDKTFHPVVKLMLLGIQV
ncbi:hypothetical protein QYE76_001461 [Lolium multiflorum]|uniref:Reverse transcriptase Ty1/copia-type domain-containing protein n=1 Tax=Lolium multiflorum TaxID=4521 RepID=A0AAD8RNV1_LOLMU|nr:hypothetical protein QYE76_001461 [Lolium multiflorum]